MSLISEMIQIGMIKPLLPLIEKHLDGLDRGLCDILEGEDCNENEEAVFLVRQKDKSLWACKAIVNKETGQIVRQCSILIDTVLYAKVKLTDLIRILIGKIG